jgi:hypothetical protein
MIVLRLWWSGRTQSERALFVAACYLSPINSEVSRIRGDNVNLNVTKTLDIPAINEHNLLDATSKGLRLLERNTLRH